MYHIGGAHCGEHVAAGRRGVINGQLGRRPAASIRPVIGQPIPIFSRRESWLKYYWVPQAIAFGYYQLSWLLYVIRPAWSYRLNADFEDHAEHEYMEFVAEHPGWETEPFESAFTDDYARFDSLADLFRQIGHDERVHKQESLAQAAASRFR